MKKEDNCSQLHREIATRDKCVFVAVLLLIFSIYQLGIKQICGFTFYPDEFGYWASAAKMMGWDWSEIASLGSYYSFGYSAFLFPVLYFAPNSAVAYQAAVFVNMLFMCLGYVLLCVISEKLLGSMPRTFRYLSSGAAVLYPAWIFYMQTTMTEALLLSLFVLIVYLFITFVERLRVLTGVLLVAVLAYFYIVHMRTVGTILACVLTLILWGISNPRSRKHVLLILGLIAIASVGAFYIKELVQQSVYVTASAEELAVNDYAGKLGNIKYIFTPEGFGSLISHLAGKVVYLGVSSLGLVYWAFAWTIGQIVGLVKKIRNRQENATIEWFAVFLLLASLAQIAISSIFYISGRNLDLYMNGRYIEFLVPMLVIVGLYHLYTSNRRWYKTICFSVVHIGLTLLTAITIWNEETQHIRSYFQVGINWMLRDNVVDTRLHLIKIACVGVVFLLFVVFLMWFIKKREIFIWAFPLFMLIEMGIALVTSVQYTYYINGQNYRERVLVDIVKEKCTPDAEIYYLDDGSAQWIDFIQMQLREQSIQVVTEEEWEQKREEMDILFTANSEKNMETYSTQFDRCVDESLLILFYNTDDEGK